MCIRDRSTVLMIMAWRGSKRLFACLFPFYLLLCGATAVSYTHLVWQHFGFLAFGHAAYLFGYGAVGEQHELLYQLVGRCV